MPEEARSGGSAALARAAFAALALGLALGAPVRAQDEGPIEVRVVSVKGSGTLEEGREPEVARRLEPWAEPLAALGMARYDFARDARGTGASGDDLDLGLALEHQAEVVAEAAGESKLRLRVRITRPDDEEPEEREKVLTAQVVVEEGRPCAVRCVEAFPDGSDLLLLIEARRASG